MKRLLIFFMFLSSLSYGQSNPIQYDSKTMRGIDFKKYKTYAWLPPVDSVTAADFDMEKIHNYIGGLITNELTARGLTIDTVKNPDILVRYSILYNRRESSKTENVYGKPNVGVGMGFGSGGYGGMSIGVSSPQVVGYKTIPITLKEGALIVDVIELSSEKTVWWGSAGRSREDKGELTNAKLVVDEVVPKIFKKFPMKKVKQKK